MDKLTIEISQVDSNKPTEVLISLGEGVEGRVNLPFDQDVALPAILKTLEKSAYREGDYDDEGINWLDENGIIYKFEEKFNLAPDRQKKIGEMLFNALFEEGNLHDEFIVYRKEAENTNQPLRLEIKYDPKAMLIGAYPWELLHDGDDYLFSGKGTLWRYITSRLPKPIRKVPRKLKILLITSRPSDTGYEWELEEEKVICKTLKQLEISGNLQLELLQPPTFDALKKYLNDNRDEKLPHIIHFDGHGSFGRLCKCGNLCIYSGAKKCAGCGAPLYGIESEGYLEFEGDQGNHKYISAEEMANYLESINLSTRTGTSQEGICLMVLSACKSAVALSGETVLNGMAQRLIKVRIPAVVAMQFDIDVKAAATFFEAFYQSIANNDPLISAISSGRIMFGPKSEHWYRPVLYMRWQDDEGGRLFDFTPETPPIEEILQMEPTEGANHLIVFSQFFDPGEGRAGKIIVDQIAIIRDFTFATIKQWRKASKGHILMIWGGKSTGKSDALNRMECICCHVRESYPLIYYKKSFKNRSILPYSIATEIIDGLIETSKFDADLNIKVEGLLGKIKKDIQESKSSPLTDKKQYDPEQLANDVYNKIKELSRSAGIVLMFDDVDELFKNNEESRKWMLVNFLPQIHEGSPNICAILTSQTNLSSDMPFSKYLRTHTAISDEFDNDLRNYAKLKYGIDLDRDEIQEIKDDAKEETGQPNWDIVELCVKWAAKNKKSQ